MSKKQVVRRRQMLVAGVGAAVLLVLALAVSALVNLLRSQSAETVPNTTAAHYDGTPVSISEYINDEDDLPAVAWNLMLVNEEHPLAEGYVPVLASVDTRWQVDERIAADTARMLEDCRAEGLQPIICSAFRSVDKQADLFADRVNRSAGGGDADEDAVAAAANIVAIPGSSEHHTGLALDIVSLDYQLLDEGQVETPENQWLCEHCADYGFILRYPVGKTDVTGIIYEPWHFRYVGQEAAKEIMERGITLEEYSAEQAAKTPKKLFGT